MKRSLLALFFCFLFFIFSLAQESDNAIRGKKVGITFSSLGENDLFRFNQLEGAASYEGHGFYVVGLNYINPINRTFSLETGFDYSYHKISVHPNLPPEYDTQGYNANFSMISIPLTLRLTFLKYAFVQAGVFIDLDINSPSGDLTGIGSNLGLGLNYDFKSGISIFLNPYAKMHTLIPFSLDRNHQNLWESGVRLGVMYRL